MEQKNETFKLEFSMDAPDIEEQLNKEGFTLGEWEPAIQGCVSAALVLDGYGVVSKTQTRKVLSKLHHDIQTVMRPYEEPKAVKKTSKKTCKSGKKPYTEPKLTVVKMEDKA